MNNNINEALSILKEFSCIEIKKVKSDAEKKQLAEALIFIASLSDAENLGVCANNPNEGFDVLKSYLTALGYDSKSIPQSISNENKSVYIKFNTAKMTHYIEDYVGEYRGVLVTIFCEDNQEIVGTYGHLPLDLFA